MTLATQLLRFCFAGIVIIGADVGMYTLFVQALPPSLSKALSFIGAGVVAYVLNKYWIFESRQRNSAAAGRFALFNLLAFGVNVLTHHGMLRLWPEAVWVALGVATAVTSTVSFVGFKWWVFRALVIAGLALAAPVAYAQPPDWRQMDPVLELVQEQSAESYRQAQEAGGRITPVQEGNSFTVWWQPEGFDPARDVTFVSLHGHAGWATKDFTVWEPVLRPRGYALLTVQWWYGRSLEAPGYAKPAQIYAWIVEALRAHGVPPGRVIFQGFSMGSANSYAVTLIDHLSTQPYFAVTIANAGAMTANFPPNQGLFDGRHGAQPLQGTHWILYCSQHDEEHAHACEDMTWTHDQLIRLGGTVELFLQDAQGGHGGFMRPRMHQQALDLAEQLVR